MATFQELAAIRRRLPTPLTPEQRAARDKAALLAPPNPSDPALANDAGVNQAYQALMHGIAQGDLNKSDYQRQLATNVQNSQNQRVQGLMNTNQGFSDRGILNSGIALKRDADVNTQFDQYDFGLNDAYQSNIRNIDMGISGLQTGYENSKVLASAAYTQQQAKAAADALLAQQQAQAQADQTALLMTQLTQQAPVVDPVADNPFVNPVVHLAPKPILKPPLKIAPPRLPIKAISKAPILGARNPNGTMYV